MQKLETGTKFTMNDESTDRCEDAKSNFFQRIFPQNILWSCLSIFSNHSFLNYRLLSSVISVEYIPGGRHGKIEFFVLSGRGGCKQVGSAMDLLPYTEPGRKKEGETMTTSSTSHPYKAPTGSLPWYHHLSLSRVFICALRDLSLWFSPDFLEKRSSCAYSAPSLYR